MRDLVVRLETEGITGSVAHAEYGFRDTWDMAEAYFPELSAQKRHSSRVSSAPLRKADSNSLLAYLKGISFALPLLFSCLAILFLKFSLWGGEVPADAATAIGLGTICSFVVSGGFVQAMARRGVWYAGTGQFRMRAASTWQWLRLGSLFITLFGFAGLAASAYFDWLPRPLGGLAAAFHVSLGLLWLSTGILYMLDRNLLVAAAALVGIGGVVLLHRLFGMELMLAQITAICAAAAFAIWMSAILFRKTSRADIGRARSQPPGKVLYHVWPYFIYGCLYYLFLFSDRVLAWTARTGNAALPIQFRGGYEAAQDLALFAFILQVGWVHSATVYFFKHLKSAQKRFGIGQCEEFNRALTEFYYGKIGSFLPLAIAPTAAVYVAAHYFGFFTGPVFQKVAIWSLVGCPFLVLSLWNVSLLFALSRPLCALSATGCACITNICIGYLLSRLGSYDQAVIGFTFGAIVFAGVSCYHSVAMLRRLDYYHFASAV